MSSNHIHKLSAKLILICIKNDLKIYQLKQVYDDKEWLVTQVLKDADFIQPAI